MPAVATPSAGGERAALARIASMGALFAASNIVRGAAAFAASVVVARRFGPDVFAPWTLCLAWSSLLTFALDLGFGVLLTRDVAANRTSAAPLLSAALAARFALLAPAGVVFVAAAPWLGLGDVSLPVCMGIVLLAGTGLAYSSIASVLRASPESFAAIVIVEGTGAVVLLAATWLVASPAGAVAVLIGLATAVRAAQCIAAVVVWRAAAAGSLRWPSLASTMALVRRGSPFVLSGLVANAQERLGPVALGLLANTSAVASFGAAWRIGSAVRLVPQAMLGGSLPVLAEEAAAARSPGVRHRFERTLGAAAAVSGIGIALLASPLVRAIYGDEYAAAAPVLVAVGLWLWPFVINSARKVGLYAGGRERTAARVSTVTLAIQAAACVVFVPRLGAAGAALALLLGEAVMWWPLRRYARASSW